MGVLHCSYELRATIADRRSPTAVRRPAARSPGVSEPRSLGLPESRVASLVSSGSIRNRNVFSDGQVSKVSQVNKVSKHNGGSCTAATSNDRRSPIAVGRPAARSLGVSESRSLGASESRSLGVPVSRVVSLAVLFGVKTCFRTSR